MKPEIGHRYGRIGGTIEFLKEEAQMELGSGVLCSLLEYEYLVEGEPAAKLFAWHWPADYIPNPHRVKKIGEFIT